MIEYCNPNPKFNLEHREYDEDFQSKPYNQKVSNRYNLRIHLRCELLLIQDLKLNTIDLKEFYLEALMSNCSAIEPTNINFRRSVFGKIQ